MSFCPSDVLELDKDLKAFAARLDTCTFCMLCELRCPDFAVQVLKGDGAGLSDGVVRNGAEETTR